jgi:hypothetical protein
VSNTEKNCEPLDAILRRAMREQPGAATPECADAESLAAYWDKSISTADREGLEAHLGGCARCLEQLAAIARAVESARDAKSASEVPWYRRWRVAIPAMAAAAAVVFVVFITMQRPSIEESRSDQLVAMAKREAPAMELAAKLPAVAPAVPAGAPTAPVAIAAAPASNEIAMNEAKTAAPPRAEAMSGATTPRMADSAAAPAARAMTAPAVAAPNAGVPGFGGKVADGIAGAGGAVSALEKTPAQPIVTISAPDQSVSWIVGKNGMVRRRDADGSVHIQHSGVSTDLAAGAAPSATVCWIVGNSGTIIRTTDGEHWVLVTSPTADNLVAVSASGTNDATITTAGGQSFATSDGGANWHPQ